MHRLAREVGLKSAMALLLTAGSIDAERARHLGLVTEVVPQSDVMAAARRIAERIMRCAPLAVQATKQCVLEGLNYAGVPAAQQAQEAGKFERLDVMLKSDDIREGLTPLWKSAGPSGRGVKFSHCKTACYERWLISNRRRIKNDPYF